MQVTASSVLLVGAFSLCTAGFICFQLTKRDDKLFNKIKKCQKIHMDYVEDIQKLPFDKNVILFGPASAIDKQKVILTQPQRKSITFDRYLKIKMPKKFNLMTAINEPVEVTIPANEIYLFNLPLISSESTNENVEVAPNYEPGSIRDGSRVFVYGKLQIMNSKTGIQPQIIIGSQIQQFLGFLDRRMLKVNKIGKYLSILGTTLYAGHITLKYKNNSIKSETLKQIEQFKTQTTNG